jgi:hypothetical protein
LTVSSSERQVRVHRLVAHFRSNLVGWIALFVALGGTGYAAVAIPRNSVGAAQIRNHAISPVKFNPKSIGGSVRAWAIVSSTGKVVASSGHPRVTLLPNVPGQFDISWSVRFPAACGTVATVNGHSPSTETIPTTVGGSAGTESVTAGYVSEVGSGTAPTSKHSGTLLGTFNQAGQPTPLGFDVAVIC